MTITKTCDCDVATGDGEPMGIGLGVGKGEGVARGICAEGLAHAPRRQIDNIRAPTLVALT
jgi:hypothetical protein